MSLLRRITRLPLLKHLHLLFLDIVTLLVGFSIKTVLLFEVLSSKLFFEQLESFQPAILFTLSKHSQLPDLHLSS